MLHRMSEREITVRKIKNLRMVSVYEFTAAVQKPDERGPEAEPNPAGCTAMTVMYGDNEQITLSELDECFEELCEQVMNVYADTKNRDSVLMDAGTRALMDAGAAIRKDPLGGHYDPKAGTPIPEIPFDATMSKRFLPLAEYLVEELEGLFAREGRVKDRIVGWRGKGILQLHRGHMDTSHMVSTERFSDTNYRMFIAEYPDSGQSLKAEIRFDPARMDMVFAIDEIEFSGEMEFLFFEKHMDVRISVTQKGKEICFETQRFQPYPQEELGEELRKLLPENIVPTVMYRLPWGMFYALKETTETSGKITRNDIWRTFLYPDAGYSETLSCTVVKNQTTQVMLRKNNLRMIRTKLPDGRYQTYFDDVGSGMTGHYRTAMAGKYFIS